jgi:thiamine-phosphate pyrophosphorylase
MKDAPDDEVRPTALEAQRMCRDAGATFIIDDRVALVKELKADGVHLGKNDMPVAEARRVLGKDFIIGGTANTFADVKAHYEAGADYIGCGPFRFTTTKKALSPVLGLEGYRHIVDRMRAENIDIPVVAIGGITKADVEDIMSTGVTGIAISGTVLGADSPVEEMRQLLRRLQIIEDRL